MLFINCPQLIQSTNMMMIKNKSYGIVKKEFKALNVGISLDILTKMATDIRYGHNIVDPHILILELLLGYHTYGMDRYNDEGILDNRTYIYDVVFMIIISMISSKASPQIALPFDCLFYITRYYKHMKPHLGIFKSIYISVMWCIAIIILPSVLHDNNFDILHEPLDYVPYILLMLSTSNRMDEKDIEDDKKNNITTIPVKYGTEISKKISNICMIISFILLCINVLQPL